MLFFKCRISFNELVSLEKQLPGDSYCISRDAHDGLHYGVINSAVFNKFLNALTGETLEGLEYLSREEFGKVLSTFENKKDNFSGNLKLLEE